MIVALPAFCNTLAKNKRLMLHLACKQPDHVGSRRLLSHVQQCTQSF